MQMVVVDEVSLRFKIDKNRASSLKEYFVRRLRRDFVSEDFWALQKVSFAVEKEMSALSAITGREKALC